MTELKKLQETMDFMDKLANGINPLSDTEHPEDTLLNDVRLIRKFFHAAQILEKVVQNGGIVGYVRMRDRKPFQITQDLKEKVELSEKPVTISGLVNSINAVSYSPDMKKLTPTQVTAWLENAGFLKTELNAEGKNQRTPTENAASIGIEQVERKNASGSAFQMNLYNMEAQAFVLDNLSSALAA